MAELPPSLPHISEPFVDQGGRASVAFYRYMEVEGLRVTSVTVTIDGVTTTVDERTGDTGVIPATFGTSLRVPVLTIRSDGRIASASQVDIAFPFSPTVQTGWPAPSALPVSNPPTQAEVVAIEARQRAIINGLRASGVFVD